MARCSFPILVSSQIMRNCATIRFLIPLFFNPSITHRVDFFFYSSRTKLTFSNFFFSNKFVTTEFVWSLYRVNVSTDFEIYFHRQKSNLVFFEKIFSNFPLQTKSLYRVEICEQKFTFVVKNVFFNVRNFSLTSAMQIRTNNGVENLLFLIYREKQGKNLTDTKFDTIAWKKQRR